MAGEGLTHRTLRLIHRWTGLVLAVLLGVAAVTGGLLLLKESYHRWRHPRLAQPIAPGERVGWPDVLTAIESRHAADGIVLVKLPQPRLNAFQIWLADGSEAFVDPRSGEMIARWTMWSSLPAFLFELHAHLLAEDTGTFVNGVAAIGAIFLTLSGLLVWWPGRRSRFRLREALRRPRFAGGWMRSHAAVGAITAPAALLFVATGAALVFYDEVSSIVTRLDVRPAETPSAAVAPEARSRAPWADVLAAVDATFPDGRAVFYYPGRDGNAVLSFRKRRPEE